MSQCGTGEVFLPFESKRGVIKTSNRRRVDMSDVQQGGEVLVVVSKLKGYIRTKSGMNTSGNVAPVLSDIVRGLCDQAIEKAREAGRKTVMDRDFKSDEM